MAWILLALGLVALLEGLVLALAPSRLDELLAQLARMPVETRRLIGLVAMAVGGTLVTLARLMGF